MAASIVLYQDKYCILTNDFIEILDYYFPSFGSCRLYYKDIAVISHFTGPSYRVWGSGDFRRWWACDASRFGEATLPRGYVFIEKKDDYWLKSFTCNDVAKVISIIMEKDSNIVRTDKKISGLSIVNTNTV
jgi:hypothetical protein